MYNNDFKQHGNSSFNQKTGILRAVLAEVQIKISLKKTFKTIRIAIQSFRFIKSNLQILLYFSHQSKKRSIISLHNQIEVISISWKLFSPILELFPAESRYTSMLSSGIMYQQIVKNFIEDMRRFFSSANFLMTFYSSHFPPRLHQPSLTPSNEIHSRKGPRCP